MGRSNSSYASADVSASTPLSNTTSSLSHSQSSKNRSRPSNPSTYTSMPKMNKPIIRSLIHQKLDEIRSGDLFVPCGLPVESVHELLTQPDVYQKFESIIGKTWMEIDIVSNVNPRGEVGLNGGKLNKKKKMYVKALKGENDFVRDQIRAYLVTSKERKSSMAMDNDVGDNDGDVGIGTGTGTGTGGGEHDFTNGHGNIGPTFSYDEDDEDDHHPPSSQQSQPHSQSQSQSLSQSNHDNDNDNDCEVEEEDTVSSLSDSKISRSSSSKRKKKRKSKKKRQRRKDKKKAKKRKRRHSSSSEEDEDENHDLDEMDVDVDVDVDDNGMNHNDEYSAVTLTEREQKRLQRRLDKARVIFEKEKREIEKKIPDAVQKDFRTLGFAKWGKDTLPIMQLGPYDVGPGAVREQWMTMFNNTLRSNRPLTRLVFWYGTPKDDLSSSFSFIPVNKVISYEKGCKLGYNQIPARIKKKMDNGKRLSGTEQMITNGIEQITEDAEKDKMDRSSWLFEYEEDYEEYLDQVEDDTSVEEDALLEDDDMEMDMEMDMEEVESASKSSSSKKKKKKKGQKSNKSKETEKKKRKRKADAVEEEEQVTQNKAKKAKSKSKSLKEKEKKEEEEQRQKKQQQQQKKQQQQQQQEVNEKEKAQEKAKAKALQNKAKKSKSRSLDEEIEEEVAEEDAVMEIEAPSDDDQHDHDFLNNSDSESDDEVEGELYEEEIKPVKKVTKAESKKKVKKQLLKSPLEIEQELFEECEKIFLPTMDKLKLVQDEADAEKLMRKIDRDVSKLTPSFFRTHHIGLVVKAVRNRFKENLRMNQMCKQVTSKMKKVFHDKLSSEPKGFVPKVKKKAAEKKVKKKPQPKIKPEKRAKSPVSDTVQSKVKQEMRVKSPVVNDDKEAVQSIKKIQRPKVEEIEEMAIPKKESLVKKEPAIISKSVTEPTPKKTPKPVKSKPPRKSFSLAGMIDRKPTPVPVSASSIEKGQGAEASPEKIVELPKWTLNYQTSDPKSLQTNPIRSFAMEFLMDAVACMSNEKIDPPSIARALEDALYTKYEGDQDVYMERIHDICAAIAGKKKIGSLAKKIVEGSYVTPFDVITIPRKLLFQSFEGFWIP